MVTYRSVSFMRISRADNFKKMCPRITRKDANMKSLFLGAVWRYPGHLFFVML